MVFKTPWIILLIPIVLAMAMVIRKKQKPSGFRFSSSDIALSMSHSWKIKLRNIPYYLRLLVLVLFLIALAGPRHVKEETIRHTEGIDIVLAIDASGSMAAEDFQINGRRENRLAIVKNVVSQFVNERGSDRLGLIAFAGVAYTVCPLTTDNTWVIKNLNRIELGQIKDGTAIGSAIASSVSRLKNSDAKSKVVILLTDGMNNAGEIDPVTAARAAAAMGIKVYTIGAGTKGEVPYPATDFFGRKVYQNVRIDLDEDTLKQIAQITHGKYFRATDTQSLRAIYKEIDTLEKTKIEEHGYKEYTELFGFVLVAALVILMLEIFLSNTVFLKVP